MRNDTMSQIEHMKCTIYDISNRKRHAGWKQIKTFIQTSNTEWGTFHNSPFHLSLEWYNTYQSKSRIIFVTLPVSKSFMLNNIVSKFLKYFSTIINCTGINPDLLESKSNQSNYFRHLKSSILEKNQWVPNYLSCSISSS